MMVWKRLEKENRNVSECHQVGQTATYPGLEPAVHPQVSAAWGRRSRCGSTRSGCHGIFVTHQSL